MTSRSELLAFDTDTGCSLSSSAADGANSSRAMSSLIFSRSPATAAAAASADNGSGSNCAFANSISLRDIQHRAAIATNNDGVTLLNRGYYRDALDTFKDSMKLMKCAKGHVKALPFAQELNACDVQRLLQRSWQRCAQCTTTTTTTTTTSSSSSSMSSTDVASFGRPVLQVISSQYSHECHMVAATTCCTFHSSLYVAFPMTIDPIDNEEVVDEDYDYESAIILYNYGMAYNCIAVVAGAMQGNRSLETLLQEKTFRIYQMADALIHKLLTTTSMSGESNACHDSATDTTTNTEATKSRSSWSRTQSLTPRCLLLNAFLTYNLIQACIQRDLPVSYRQHCQRLEQLLSQLAAHESLLPHTLRNDDGLAAAA